MVFQGVQVAHVIIPCWFALVLLKRQAINCAYAIGQLDGAAKRSPIAAIWRERASVIGLANCLALAGIQLTPAEFFRSVVGLVDHRFVTDIDRQLLSAVVAEWQLLVKPGNLTKGILRELHGKSPLLVGDEWIVGCRPSAQTRQLITSALTLGKVAEPDDRTADVGTALSQMVSRVAAALADLRAQRGAMWYGWLIAAHLPDLLIRLRLTTTSLPCLSGLVRAMRYTTTDRHRVEALLLSQITDEANLGLALLRRLEDCAAAWHKRLDGLTPRSRAGRAAALFMVWPAMTRSQLASSLGVSATGASKILKILTQRDIVEAAVHHGKVYHVAPECLGEFKIQARQGPQRAGPPAASVIGDLEDALAAIDRLDANTSRLLL